MLNAACSRSISDRLPSAEGGDFFFQPLQFHLEPADLLEQLLLLSLGVGYAFDAHAAGDDAFGAYQQLLLPAVNQRRMDAVLGRQFVDGPDRKSTRLNS